MDEPNDHQHCDDRSGHEAPHATSLAKGPGAIARILLLPIRFYQKFISPMTPPVCRFAPTCSEYSRQALIKHGALKGAWLGLRRLLRCHPLNAGGYDPVP